MSGETWQQLKERQQKEVSAFPSGCAFRDDDLPEVYSKLGVNGPGELLSIGMGMIIRKADRENWLNLMRTQRDEVRALLSDFERAAEAVRYEAHNHEYEINWDGEWDLCGVFGVPFSDEVGPQFDKVAGGDVLRRAWAEGLRRYRADCRERERREAEGEA